jgi:hypothetical protein
MRKLFCIIIASLAVILGILGITLPRDPAHLQWIVIVTNFFDMMIPVLAVGALINYIWKSNSES